MAAVQNSCRTSQNWSSQGQDAGRLQLRQQSGQFDVLGMTQNPKIAPEDASSEHVSLYELVSATRASSRQIRPDKRWGNTVNLPCTC